MKFLCLLPLLLLSACQNYGQWASQYDRSYSLSYSDGKQAVGVGVTLHPRTLPKPQK